MSVGRVGWLGLGHMGRGMALRALERGISVSVTVHRDPEPVAALERAGATVAHDAMTLARDSDVVVSILTGPHEVAELADSGVLAAMRPGRVFVEMSTIDVALSRALARDCESRGVGYVDAPVDRGPLAARQGTLALFVGGAPEDVTRVRPLLDALATDIYHVGGPGRGHTLKLVKNSVSQSMTALYAEAFAFADAAGIERSLLLEILTAGPANSMQLERYAAAFVTRDTDMRVASVHNVVKDLGLATELARSAGMRISLPETALALYRRALDLGYATCDASSVSLIAGTPLAAIGTDQSASEDRS